MLRVEIPPRAGLPKEQAHPAAVRVDNLIFFSGPAAPAFHGGLPPAARVDPRFPFHRTPIKLQTDYLYRMLGGVLESAGSSLGGVVRFDQFFVGGRQAEAYLEEWDRLLPDDRPTSTALDVPALPAEDALLELDGIAAADPADRRLVFTEASLPPVAGYSQGILVGDWHFLAGATASDFVGAGPYPGGAGTGIHASTRVNPNYWHGTGIKQQTRYVLREKLLPILQASGMSFDDLVKVNVWLTDLPADLAGFHEAWGEAFPNGGPAVAIVPVRSINPLGGRIEITPIARRGGGRALAPAGELRIDGPTVRAGNLVFFSTQLPEPLGDAAHQLAGLLELLARACRAAGGELRDLAALRVFLAEPGDFDGVRRIVAERLDGRAALTAICIPGPLPTPGARIVVDAVAAIEASD